MNLPRLKAAGVKFVHGDVRSLEDLTGVKPEPDLILELRLPVETGLRGRVLRL